MFNKGNILAKYIAFTQTMLYQLHLNQFKFQQIKWLDLFDRPIRRSYSKPGLIQAGLTCSVDGAIDRSLT